MKIIKSNNLEEWHILFNLYLQLNNIIYYTEEFVLKARKGNVTELEDLFISESFKEAIKKVKSHNNNIIKTAHEKLTDYFKEDSDIKEVEQEHLSEINKNNIVRLEYEFETLIICDDDGWYKVSINELVVPNINEIQEELNIINDELIKAKERIKSLFNKGLIRRLKY